MEEGRQKSKRLSYTAKFKREVIRCAEEKGNRKAAAIFGINESNVQLWQNTTQRSAGLKRHEGNSLDPRNDDFLAAVI
jgi:transposase-like protein